MASKTVELLVPLSVDLCFQTLEKVGHRVKGFKMKEANNRLYRLIWEQGFTFRANSTKIEANFQPISTNETKLTLKCSLGQLVDLTGVIDENLTKYLEPFGIEVQNILVLQSHVGQGLICPTCMANLAPGTKFCPNDGTPIGKTCPTCKQLNTPIASFCVSCGSALS